MITGGTVELDVTWENKSIPYYIVSNVYVQGTDGADNVTTLEIAAGTQMKFSGSGLYIGHDFDSNYTGALRAIGTVFEPIRLQARFDWKIHLLPYA